MLALKAANAAQIIVGDTDILSLSLDKLIDLSVRFDQISLQSTPPLTLFLPSPEEKIDARFAQLLAAKLLNVQSHTNRGNLIAILFSKDDTNAVLFVKANIKEENGKRGLSLDAQVFALNGNDKKCGAIELDSNSIHLACIAPSEGMLYRCSKSFNDQTSFDCVMLTSNTNLGGASLADESIHMDALPFTEEDSVSVIYLRNSKINFFQKRFLLSYGRGFAEIEISNPNFILDRVKITKYNQYTDELELLVSDKSGILSNYVLRDKAIYSNSQLVSGVSSFKYAFKNLIVVRTIPTGFKVSQLNTEGLSLREVTFGNNVSFVRSQLTLQYLALEVIEESKRVLYIVDLVSSRATKSNLGLVTDQFWFLLPLPEFSLLGKISMEIDSVDAFKLNPFDYFDASTNKPGVEKDFKVDILVDKKVVKSIDLKFDSKFELNAPQSTSVLKGALGPLKYSRKSNDLHTPNQYFSELEFKLPQIGDCNISIFREGYLYLVCYGKIKVFGPITFESTSGKLNIGTEIFSVNIYKIIDMMLFGESLIVLDDSKNIWEAEIGNLTQFTDVTLPELSDCVSKSFVNEGLLCERAKSKAFYSWKYDFGKRIESEPKTPSKSSTVFFRSIFEDIYMSIENVAGKFNVVQQNLLGTIFEIKDFSIGLTADSKLYELGPDNYIVKADSKTIYAIIVGSVIEIPLSKYAPDLESILDIKTARGQEYFLVSYKTKNGGQGAILCKSTLEIFQRIIQVFAHSCPIPNFSLDILDRKLIVLNSCGVNSKAWVHFIDGPFKYQATSKVAEDGIEKKVIESAASKIELTTVNTILPESPKFIDLETEGHIKITGNNLGLNLKTPHAKIQFLGRTKLQDSRLITTEKVKTIRGRSSIISNTSIRCIGSQVIIGDKSVDLTDLKNCIPVDNVNDSKSSLFFLCIDEVENRYVLTDFVNEIPIMAKWLRSDLIVERPFRVFYQQISWLVVTLNSKEVLLLKMTNKDVVHSEIFDAAEINEESELLDELYIKFNTEKNSIVFIIHHIHSALIHKFSFSLISDEIDQQSKTSFGYNEGTEKVSFDSVSMFMIDDDLHVFADSQLAFYDFSLDKNASSLTLHKSYESLKLLQTGSFKAKVSRTSEYLAVLINNNDSHSNIIIYSHEKTAEKSLVFDVLGKAQLDENYEILDISLNESSAETYLNVVLGKKNEKGVVVSDNRFKIGNFEISFASKDLEMYETLKMEFRTANGIENVDLNIYFENGLKKSALRFVTFILLFIVIALLIVNIVFWVVNRKNTGNLDANKVPIAN